MATTRKGPLERDTQRLICDYLRERGILFWRSNNVPAPFISKDGKRSFRSLPKDTPRGLPDIMIIRDGKFIALEVKRQGAKLRPEQAEFGSRLVINGAEYHKVCSLEDVRAIPSLHG